MTICSICHIRPVRNSATGLPPNKECLLCYRQQQKAHISKVMKLKRGFDGADRRDCDSCGVEFQQNMVRQRYCSADCKKKLAIKKGNQIWVNNENC